MTICDAHMHFFSLDFFQLLARQAAAARGAQAEHLLAELARKTGLELPSPDPREHARRWLAELDLNGVDKAVIFASLPAEKDAVLAGAGAAAGRLIPYLLVDPTSPEGLEAGGRGVAELGFRGILLFPALHRFDPAAPALDTLYREAGEQGAPVVIHCGLLEIKLRDLLGVRPAYDLRPANPLAVAAAAERHRGTRFIVPHFGSGCFAETLLAGAQTPNLYIDTSSSNSWMRACPYALTLEQVFEKSLEVFGPRRILFGTDSSTFPRGWRVDILRAQRQALDAIGLAEEDKAKILGGNLGEILALA